MGRKWISIRWGISITVCGICRAVAVSNSSLVILFRESWIVFRFSLSFQRQFYVDWPSILSRAAERPSNLIKKVSKSRRFWDHFCSKGAQRHPKGDSEIGINGSKSVSQGRPFRDTLWKRPKHALVTIYDAFGTLLGRFWDPFCHKGAPPPPKRRFGDWNT